MLQSFLPELFFFKSAEEPLVPSFMGKREKYICKPCENEY